MYLRLHFRSHRLFQMVCPKIHHYHNHYQYVYRFLFHLLVLCNHYLDLWDHQFLLVVFVLKVVQVFLLEVEFHLHLQVDLVVRLHLLLDFDFVLQVVDIDFDLVLQVVDIDFDLHHQQFYIVLLVQLQLEMHQYIHRQYLHLLVQIHLYLQLHHIQYFLMLVR